MIDDQGKRGLSGSLCVRREGVSLEASVIALLNDGHSQKEVALAHDIDMMDVAGIYASSHGQAAIGISMKTAEQLGRVSRILDTVIEMMADNPLDSDVRKALKDLHTVKKGMIADVNLTGQMTLKLSGLPNKFIEQGVTKIEADAWMLTKEPLTVDEILLRARSGDEQLRHLCIKHNLMSKESDRFDLLAINITPGGADHGQGETQ